MSAVATRARRRHPRGACDDPPRLWGEEPSPVARTAPESPASLPAEEESAAAGAPSRARTLDDLIAGAWDGLIAAGPVACPVCAAPMTPRWSAGAGVVGGRCGGCGSTLE